MVKKLTETQRRALAREVAKQPDPEALSELVGDMLHKAGLIVDQPNTYDGEAISHFCVAVDVARMT